MKKNSPLEARSWLEDAYPQMHFLLLALDGDEPARRWLADNSSGVALLTRVLEGEPRALAHLDEGKPIDLDDLFELIDNEDLVAWLSERRPELHLLFDAIQGNHDSLGQLKRRKPDYLRLVAPFRKLHETFVQKTRNGNGLIEGGVVAADMSCLIGEMHLRDGDYEKAIEAFSRAIESQPAPDLFEGRARAYRGLAERDEQRARGMR
jgi:tetratricopeptide (TPR) repeat protein